MSNCIHCGPAVDVSNASQLGDAGPRRAWVDHPNYPAQVLLLGSHDGFRRLSRYLVGMAAERPRGWRAKAELLYRYWHQGMRGHEGYEEYKLYPYLARRHGTSMASLKDDHEEMHALRDQVYAAFEGGTDDALQDSLARYDALLVAHLAREEATVIPLLLDLPSREFERYTRSSIDELLASMPPCEPTADASPGAQAR
jgi:Hemerythrin HHE cation binding domain